jgi:hypothetical protein
MKRLLTPSEIANNTVGAYLDSNPQASLSSASIGSL